MRVFCPKCRTEHEVSDDLAGSRVRCANPECRQTFTIPTNAGKGAGTRRLAPSFPENRENADGATPDSGSSSKSAPLSPPPLSGADRPFEVDTGSPKHRTGASRFANQVQRLNLADMVMGKDKEHVFPLLPGEERIDELEFDEIHLFFIRRGIIRVTLTSHRLLYTKTRVFSPFYWLLLVLCFPLIFYYLFRISRNMSVAIPLASIDSYEKRYFPNWALLIVAAVLSYLIAGVFVFAVMMAVDKPEDSIVLAWTIRSTVLGVLGPALLVLLLAT